MARRGRRAGWGGGSREKVIIPFAMCSCASCRVSVFCVRCVLYMDNDGVAVKNYCCLMAVERKHTHTYDSSSCKPCVRTIFFYLSVALHTYLNSSARFLEHFTGTARHLMCSFLLCRVCVCDGRWRSREATATATVCSLAAAKRNNVWTCRFYFYHKHKEIYSFRTLRLLVPFLRHDMHERR